MSQAHFILEGQPSPFSARSEHVRAMATHGHMWQGHAVCHSVAFTSMDIK